MDMPLPCLGSTSPPSHTFSTYLRTFSISVCHTHLVKHACHNLPSITGRPTRSCDGCGKVLPTPPNYLSNTTFLPCHPPPRTAPHRPHPPAHALPPTTRLACRYLPAHTQHLWAPTLQFIHHMEETGRRTLTTHTPHAPHWTCPMDQASHTPNIGTTGLVAASDWHWAS